MKILVVCQHYFPENFSITEICERFASKGNVVTVLTALPSYGKNRFYQGYESAFREVRKGVTICRVYARPRNGTKLSIIQNYYDFWKNSKQFVRHFREKYDVVYSMVLSPIIAASSANLYARLHHVPHIHHCLDIWPESVVATGILQKKSLGYLFLLLWSKLIYKRMDKILVSSPSFERYFREVIHLRRVPIEYVPQPSLATELVGEPFIYKHRYIFIYAGNIGSIQLVENFVQACGFLKGEIDFSFEIFGDGTDFEKVRNLINCLKLQDEVCLRGRFPSGDMPKFFDNATALVLGLSSKSEWVSCTIPNKLVTYMAYGKPIIAALKGDGSAVLKSSGGGYITTEDPKSIAAAMKKLVTLSDDERSKMGQNNRKYFVNHFNTKVIVDEISSCLEKPLPILQ
jgi:glycosyltransferase involved in cell wall biosynthesis